MRSKTEKLISTSVGGVASPALIGKRETEKFIFNLFAGFLNRIGEPVGAQTMLRVSATRLTADSFFSHLVDFLEIRALDITAQDQLEADLDLLFASIGSPDQRLALSASYQRYNGDVQRAVLPGLDIDFFAVINRSTGTALLFILVNKSGPNGVNQ